MNENKILWQVTITICCSGGRVFELRNPNIDLGRPRMEDLLAWTDRFATALERAYGPIKADEISIDVSKP